MSSPFPEQVTPGGVLVFPQIQSPNFVTTVAGWRIARDGSAEFNNVTIRGGTVLGGTELTYSSLPPALGNLVASQSGTSFFDSAGNLVLAGNVGYTFIGAEPAYYAVVSSSNGVAVFRAATEAGPWTQVGGVAYLHGGFQGIQLYNQASGASLTVGDAVDSGGNVFAALAGVFVMTPAIGTPIVPVAGDAGLYATANGHEGWVDPSGAVFVGGVAHAEGSALPQTISSTAAANVTGCTVPKLAPGTYRFRAEVIYKGGSAAGTANFGMGFSGTTSAAKIAGLFSNGSVGLQLAALATVNSQTLTTTNTWAIITGELTVTASGDLALQCAEGTTGDTVIIAFAQMEVWATN